MINKKIIAMGLTVTMLITFSACTQDTSTKDKAQDENNQTEEEVIQSEESSEETDGEEDVPESESNTQDEKVTGTEIETEPENATLNETELQYLEFDKLKEYVCANKMRTIGDADGDILRFDPELYGTLNISCFDDEIYLTYESYNCAFITAVFNKYTDEVRLDYNLIYGDGSNQFYNSEFVTREELPTCISMADERAVESGTLAEINEDCDLSDDLMVLYARLINMSESVFDTIGTSSEALGIDWGEDYVDVDVKAKGNCDYNVDLGDHQFENGVCTDCGLSWFEYVYMAINTIAPEVPCIYGPHSEDDYSLETIVQLDTYFGTDLMAFSCHDSDENGSEHFQFQIYPFSDTVLINAEAEYGYQYYEDEMAQYYLNGVNVQIECDKTQVAEILSSEDEFMDSMILYVSVLNPDTREYTYERLTSKKQYEAFFKDIEYEHPSFDEFVSFSYEYIKDGFLSFDHAFEVLNTSFEDFGLIYQ